MWCYFLRSASLPVFFDKCWLISCFLIKRGLQFAVFLWPYHISHWHAQKTLVLNAVESIFSKRIHHARQSVCIFSLQTEQTPERLFLNFQCKILECAHIYVAYVQLRQYEQAGQLAKRLRVCVFGWVTAAKRSFQGSQSNFKFSGCLVCLDSVFSLFRHGDRKHCDANTHLALVGRNER